MILNVVIDKNWLEDNGWRDKEICKYHLRASNLQPLLDIIQHHVSIEFNNDNTEYYKVSDELMVRAPALIFPRSSPLYLLPLPGSIPWYLGALL